MTALKNWVMVILTLAFVMLYSGVLFGWLRPLSDVSLVVRLEPIIFIVIGLYFGRLPARQNEKNLKEEIERQIKKVCVVQLNCEHAKQERELLEEKLKNAQAILMRAETNFFSKMRGEKTSVASDENSVEILKHSMKTAVRVLNS